MDLKVTWKGPDDEVDSSTDHELITLLSHQEIKNYFSEVEIIRLKKLLGELLSLQRRLYSDKKLFSEYHNFSHHYTTTVTVLRAVIGALILKKQITSTDLELLLIASLLHDIGYLEYKKKPSAPDIHSHNERTYDFSKLIIEKYFTKYKKNIRRIIQIQKSTEYDLWKDVKIWKTFNIIEQILIGADLLQVADINYSENRNTLNYFLFTTEHNATITSEQLFFKLAQTGSYFIWDYLDAFFGKNYRNPYREQWKVFKNSYKLQLDVS